MGEVQEQRFVCKFCDKSFFSGKSLGGHMRGHLALISAQKAEENDNVQSDSINAFEYALRENPKKSWRLCGSISNDLKKENVCKKCGKGFQSIRALSGHMRSHSTKQKEEHACEKCGKAFDSMRALFGHLRSHSLKRSADTTTFPTPVKRSRTRCKSKITTPNPCSNDSSQSDEVEGAAMCLMMMSRGVRTWVEFTKIEDGLIKNDKPREKVGDLGSGFASDDETQIGLDFKEGKIDDNGLKCNADLSEEEIVLELERGNELKTGKEHECSICYKVFGSGQALGGHKRAHYIDQDQTNDIHTILDLNLPITLEEGDAGDFDFKPYWVVRDDEYEPMMMINH